MVQVNGTNTPGVGATDLGKAEDAPHASSDTGLFILGVRNDNLATSFSNTDQDYTPLAVNNRGAIWASLAVAGSSVADGSGVSPTGHAASAAQNQSIGVGPVLFNGTTWDRQRGNVDQTVGITASGVTTTQTGADQTNYNGRGVIVVLDMTNVGTGSVTLEIDGKDLSSGKYYALLTGAAVTTNSTNVYTVYPGNTVTANVSASTVLPRVWRVKVTANNANATTYTVSASVIV